MLPGFFLMASVSRRGFQTLRGILGRLILSIGLISKPLIMRDLVKVPGWFQALTCIPTWSVLHLLEDNFWVLTLDIQRCYDTLSWVTRALVSTSLLGSWRFPFQVSCSLFCLIFVACKTIVSALLRSSILIWHAVSFLLLSLGGSWSSFSLFCFGSGCWLHSRVYFTLYYYWLY